MGPSAILRREKMQKRYTTTKAETNATIPPTVDRAKTSLLSILGMAVVLTVHLATVLILPVEI